MRFYCIIGVRKNRRPRTISMESNSLIRDKKVAGEEVRRKSLILVIDDDAETTELLQAMLESQAYEVVISNSGHKGVEIIRRIDPDVVIVDLLMPDMDGLSVCKAVRTFSSVPILVLSAIGKPGTLEKALENGADDYLVKPMKSQVFLAYVNRLARRARAEKVNHGGNGRK